MFSKAWRSWMCTYHFGSIKYLRKFTGECYFSHSDQMVGYKYTAANDCNDLLDRLSSAVITQYFEQKHHSVKYMQNATIITALLWWLIYINRRQLSRRQVSCRSLWYAQDICALIRYDIPHVYWLKIHTTYRSPQNRTSCLYSNALR